MTTLVATQRALEHLSMSNHQDRRQTKRPAAAADFECDDDFQFVRKAKKTKTEESGLGSRTTGQSRTASAQAVTESTAPPTRDAVPLSTSATPGRRKSSRRKPPDDAPQNEETQPARRTTRRSTRSATAEADQSAQDSRLNGGTGTKTASPDRGQASKPRRWEPSPTPRRPTESKIALPMSDTPIINRNKEMRKKGGKGNRRSSLGSRGRRASSLIQNGQTALPHRDVDTSEFYKHIQAEVVEPERMRNLLMWCGGRALPEKPPHGTANANAILGALAIQDQILKDFAQRGDFSNWFSRDEDGPTQAAILKPNPRNIELDEKLVNLEARIKKLQEEKQAWLAIRQPPPDIPPIFNSSEPPKIELPDFNLLEPEEVKIRSYLAKELVPFADMRAKTEERIRKIQSSLEFEVDQLADNVHKLEQRVLVAGRQADKVLRHSATRLKEREDRDKKSAGTRDMPLMEVLRSLSNILPEGGG